MVSSGMLLISPAVATALESTLITSVPSLAQFTSTAATKCVAFGLPAVATAALGARGGAVDLERVDLRLDSLEQYCVIASIILGSMIDIYGDTPREQDEEEVSPIEHLVHSANAMCLCLGFMSAIYTTVIFTLLSLYAKTALGTGNDAAYLELMKATGTIRYRGFQAFLVCLTSFNVSLIMNMFLNHNGKTRWILFAMSSVGTIISLVHFRFIVMTATQIIFR